MLLTEYETTLVLRPNISGDTIETTLDKIRNTLADGGKLLAINHWGKKRLAYEIKKHNRGIYVHTHYLGVGPQVAEIERFMRLSEDVLRFLTVRLAEDINPTERETHEYVAPTYEAVDETMDDASDDDIVEFGARDDYDDGNGSDDGIDDDRDHGHRRRPIDDDDEAKE